MDVKGIKKRKNKGNTIVHEQYRTNNTLKKQVTPYNLSSKNLYKTHTFIILNLQKNETKTGKTDTIPYIKEKISRRIITPSFLVIGRHGDNASLLRPCCIPRLFPRTSRQQRLVVIPASLSSPPHPVTPA